MSASKSISVPGLVPWHYHWSPLNYSPPPVHSEVILLFGPLQKYMIDWLIDWCWTSLHLDQNLWPTCHTQAMNCIAHRCMALLLPAICCFCPCCPRTNKRIDGHGTVLICLTTHSPHNKAIKDIRLHHSCTKSVLASHLDHMSHSCRHYNANMTSYAQPGLSALSSHRQHAWQTGEVNWLMRKVMPKNL